MSTHSVIRVLLCVLYCQIEACSQNEIYPPHTKKSGCASTVETLELVQIKINTLDLVFFGKFPKIIFSHVSDLSRYLIVISGSISSHPSCHELTSMVLSIDSDG